MSTGRLQATMFVTGLVLFALVVFGLVSYLGGDHGAGHNPRTTTVQGLDR